MEQPAIIVTGASRGLGAAATRIAARYGASVVLAARSLDDLQAEAHRIEATGGRAVAVRADVSLEADCRAVVEASLERFGRVDGLVNNGGIIEPMGPIAQADPEEWQRAWAVNLLGPVLLIRLALPYLRQAHGRVINISSGAAQSPVGGWGAYGTSKAALDHLTRILAAEEPDITTLALRPGIVDTAMQAEIRELGKARMAQANYSRLYGAYESGRLLPPELPGRAMACLALYAPHEWSGEALGWDDEKLQALVRRYGEGDGE